MIGASWIRGQLRERQPSQTTSAAKPPSTAQLTTDEIPSEGGFIGVQSPPSLALAPGRGGVPGFGRGHILRPNAHLPSILPLEQNHSVGHLKPVLIHLEISEHRSQLHPEELLADPV